MKNMFTCSEKSVNRGLSDWGKEVKKRLLDLQMQQNDLVNVLNEKGFNINKHVLSNLLRGVGAPSRKDEIREINYTLGIPQA